NSEQKVELCHPGNATGLFLHSLAADRNDMVMLEELFKTRFGAYCIANQSSIKSSEKQQKRLAYIGNMILHGDTDTAFRLLEEQPIEIRLDFLLGIKSGIRDVMEKIINYKRTDLVKVVVEKARSYCQQ